MLAQQPQYSMTMKLHYIGDSEIIQHASQRAKVTQTIEINDLFNRKNIDSCGVY